MIIYIFFYIFSISTKHEKLKKMCIVYIIILLYYFL